MAASANLLLSALSKQVPAPAAPADDAAPGVTTPCPFEDTAPLAPLTSEPPLAHATPLTSEPPLADIAPLTSEPTAYGAAGGASTPGV
ncbi:hypothetical protein [Streptomyces sp. PR69]|uniref:hypothetical protein n=1 Tax=Streptomyces sp. PR69 TaxID=2984950 RepID=UPI002263D03D|nr:hypothetical protein [Streptomyces sp. PR69]